MTKYTSRHTYYNIRSSLESKSSIIGEKLNQNTTVNSVKVEEWNRGAELSNHEIGIIIFLQYYYFKLSLAFLGLMVKHIDFKMSH